MSGLFLFACNTETTAPNEIDAPRSLEGVFKYNGPVYAPLSTSKPINYTLYSINGDFIAYVDITSALITRVDQYLDKVVVVRGIIKKDDGNVVLKADSIRIKR